MTAADAEACAVAAAADIICSFRGADLAGWTPPWGTAAAKGKEVVVEEEEEEELAWPTVARGKRSRSSRRRSPSGSGSAATKGRWARGSPASPLDYSGGSGSGSAASTSGGEDGAFCSPPPPPPPVVTAAAATTPTAAPTPSPAKVGPAGRRQLILPTPPPRPAGQRPRKKMRLPEIQQLVRSLTVENDGLREEMVALQRACTALSKENCKLETRLEKSSKRNGTKSEGQQARPQPDEPAAKQESQNGFVLPDLNLPVEDMAADGSAP
uniref:BZIP domain-containing protein n=1 Tax=Oryza glumipatula TaxID=40148 RepID=A0A0E0ACJ3_9ORYZ